MPIGDYCEKPAATVRGGETLRRAAERMRDEGLGSLVVVTDGRPAALVTDRDLGLEVLCNRLDPGAVTVDEIASRPLVRIEQDRSVREAVRMIRRHGIRRLPVVDDKGQLVGIVAADDLLSLAAAELNGLADAVRAQSPGDVGRREIETIAARHYLRDVATIPSECSVRRAAETMRAQAVGSLVVLDNGKPVGIVTDRDLLERVVAIGHEPASTAIDEVMSEPLRVASPEDPLDQIVEIMSSFGVRRVPIVEEGELVGIVTLDDILAGIAEELRDLAEGTRREVHMAQHKARAREIARDVGQQFKDLGELLEHVGAEAKSNLLREIDELRERIRGRKH